VNDPAAEATRRRTFAIISHPDAGKTTLTEKFLLYGGALSSEAGAVKARSGRRSATSDWMALEQQRGISITSTVLQFPIGTTSSTCRAPRSPHFSEDTYRALAAADAAAGRCSTRPRASSRRRSAVRRVPPTRPPAASFITSGLGPAATFELLDEIEQQIGLTPIPITWPVGIAGTSAAWSTAAPTSSPGSPRCPRRHRGARRSWSTPNGRQSRRARRRTAEAEVDLLDGTVGDLDTKAPSPPRPLPCCSARRSPTRRAKAARRRADQLPASTPRPDVDGVPARSTPFSGSRSQGRSNMDLSH
jgi:peptide chain release factor 3